MLTFEQNDEEDDEYIEMPKFGLEAFADILREYCQYHDTIKVDAVCSQGRVPEDPL